MVTKCNIIFKLKIRYLVSIFIIYRETLFLKFTVSLFYPIYERQNKINIFLDICVLPLSFRYHYKHIKTNKLQRFNYLLVLIYLLHYHSICIDFKNYLYNLKTFTEYIRHLRYFFVNFFKI